MKLRKLQSVLLATSGILLAVSPAAHALDAGAVGDGTVGGVVRDSSGLPQIDVLVQLMRADSTVVRTVRTDEHGHYLIAGVMPGLYQLKAIETSFLPTLRENLRIGTRGRTEANLTLSTLIEALQWLPAHKRTSSEPQDDWTWTLRSAAYRPLLRFTDENGVDSGLETIDTPETRNHPHQGRFLIESGTRSFAEGGPSQTVEYSRQSLNGAQILLRSSISEGTSIGVSPSSKLVAGFAHENAVGSGLSSVVSYQINPTISDGQHTGMSMVRLRTADTIQLTPDITAEIGNQVELLSIGAASHASSLPYVNVAWSNGSTAVRYVVSTSPRLQDVADLADDRSLLPAAELHNGILGVEHGLHQEIRLEHTNDSGSMSESVAFYEDEVRNPIVDGYGNPGQAGIGDYLYDGENGSARIAGNAYAAHGIVGKIDLKGPGSTHATLQYASGSALTLAGNTQLAYSDAGTSPVLKPEEAKAIAMQIEGEARHAGTRWRTSYRWQRANTVNAVDLFDTGMADAYLSVFLRQSLHLSHIVPGGVDAVVDVRNLLAQGYHPFLTTDGNNTLFFAQVNRSIQGGLAFYF